MGSLNIRIRDDVERVFRAAVQLLFGKRRGGLSEAGEEAIQLWIRHRMPDLLKDPKFRTLLGISDAEAEALITSAGAKKPIEETNDE